MKDDPLFRRIRQHAEKRLRFSETQSDKARVEQLKEFLHLENLMIRRYHEKGDSGLRVARARAVIMDVLIQSLHEYALKLSKDFLAKPKPMALFATGGFGRGELCPHSDLDLMFLYPKSASGKPLETLKEIMTREILYPLWDLGLKVGHSSRSILETLEESKKDIRTKNALLDSRFLSGDKSVAENFLQKFAKSCIRKNREQYLRKIIAGQVERRKQKGETVFLQTPDVKNGTGGLRDYQAILWMAKVRYGDKDLDGLIDRKLVSASEAKTFKESYSFLLRVRNELHFGSKRPNDVLHLEKQPEIAQGLGFEQEDIFERVEAFMGEYYSRTRLIRQTSEGLEALLAPKDEKQGLFNRFVGFLSPKSSRQAKEMDGFLLSDGILEALHPKVLDEDPERILRVFRHSQKHHAKLAPSLRGLIRNRLSIIDGELITKPSANVTFRSILQELGSVAPTLYSMHELGVLGRFVPEFERLTCKVQHELYHRYTADAHIIQCIRELDKIFQDEESNGRPYHEIIRRTDVPALLYLMLFLHDLGKDEGPKGHCERGERIAGNLLQRLAVPSEMHERVLFVVKNHLEMVRYFLKYDLEDSEVIDAFAGLVGSEQRLCYLYVHSYCDAKGTSPELWNDHKDELHHQLFTATLRTLRGRPARRNPETLRSSYRELKVDQLTKNEISEQLDLFPDRYFAHAFGEEVALHLSMTERFSKASEGTRNGIQPAPIVEWRDDLRRSLTIVHVLTTDRERLFEKLAGAFAICGMNILSARAFTRLDGLAIDVFFIEKDFLAAKEKEERSRETLEQTLRDVLEGKSSPEQLIMERIRKLERRQTYSTNDKLGATIAPKVDLYRDVVIGRTIVEVSAADRPGLLHLIAKNISSCGLNITFARIATEHGVATDIFHVETSAPKETYSPARYLELRERLGKALVEGSFQVEV